MVTLHWSDRQRILQLWIVLPRNVAKQQSVVAQQFLCHHYSKVQYWPGVMTIGRAPVMDKLSLVEHPERFSHTRLSVGQPKVSKVNIFLPFLKFMKRPQTKFHAYTIRVF